MVISKNVEFISYLSIITKEMRLSLKKIQEKLHQHFQILKFHQTQWNPSKLWETTWLTLKQRCKLQMLKRRRNSNLHLSKEVLPKHQLHCMYPRVNQYSSKSQYSNLWINPRRRWRMKKKRNSQLLLVFQLWIIPSLDLTHSRTFYQWQPCNHSLLTRCLW